MVKCCFMLICSFSAPSCYKSNTTSTGIHNDVDKLLENFTLDNSTYSLAQIRASFYPKFENEKSDQVERTRIIELVSKGLAILEVTLKHSGSLFMYAGPEGGAYSKNSYGNIYTAVGVFVLGRTFDEAWGSQANKIKAEFNEFIELNRMCISMELVTAILDHHGQCPHEDYVVVTAITELGAGKPKFYSTPDIIAFCRKWRLPTNHVWLFSTRKSVMSFFAAYDALCEEGTTTLVCKALNEVAVISFPGSKDHVKVQGEILEGLVARTVGNESLILMEQVLRDYPPTLFVGANHHLRPSLREIYDANRTDKKQLIKELLESVGTSFCPNYLDWCGNEASDSRSRNVDLDSSVISKFLQARPADFTTMKLQEMLRLMRDNKYHVAFKCYHNFHKINSVASDNRYFKMVIHVLDDSTFRKYHKEMRYKQGLWPLYRGFFVDLNIFKANKERVVEFSKEVDATVGTGSDAKDGLADKDANLMIKLKFLTYKLRTFLIRNGLSTLFNRGEAAYMDECVSQMQKWNISTTKETQLCKMLGEWAVYIRRKCGHKALSSSTYLSEAEPFLEQFASRTPQNLALVGSAGSLVRVEDFYITVKGGRDEEEGEQEREETTPPMVIEAIRKDEGVIVFFPGIPGCAKSALCEEILGSSGGLGDDRPVHSLMGDLIRGNYWKKVAEERRKKPSSILLADKNAPNEDAWRKIENICSSTKVSAIPVVPDSEGTESNPFSLDSLAVFIFRVLNRVNHPGKLDKSSPNVGYVLLMFYHLYDGKSRKDFETELIERFGSLVKMPLLRFDRSPMPECVTSILEEGINLYELHYRSHGRLDSTKGKYSEEWEMWEKQLRCTLLENAEYLNSIQVRFDFVVQEVRKQIKAAPIIEKGRSGSPVFAAITLSVSEILVLLDNIGKKDRDVEDLLKTSNLKSSLTKPHVTLAHKGSHGVTAVASYGPYLHQKIAISITVLLFSEKLAALEANPVGLVDGEKISSKNEWPHVTLWTAQGIAPKAADMLPKLVTEGKATRVEINPPITLTGILEFY
ncbi:hypothetical protein ACJIZ3_009190 [Penstemon smallii]|uniref:tRNA ligase phosphodiesterase domain-containing protein n=1 Tax=Penstemon smallii TaxID=265156 RepID=A0ABD3TBW6_9LAMI